MRKQTGKKPAVVLAIMAASLAATTGVVLMNNTRTVPPELAKKDDKVVKTEKIKNYTPKFDDKGNMSLEEKTAPAGSGSVQLEVEAVNSYLAKVPAVPKAAKLLSIKMDGATANLNFSKEFEAGYGTQDEQAIINGVLVTLAQFPHIKRAQFMIDGKPTQGIGNIDLSEPQDVIQPEDLGKEEEEISSASDPSKP